MKSFVEGSKYFVVSLKGLHCVNPFFVLSAPWYHSKTVPYWLVFKPRCTSYHSLTFLGSLHLKKIPPMPVTFFIFACPLDCLVMIVLNAKPKLNDVAIAKISNDVFFICLNVYRFYCFREHVWPRPQIAVVTED